MNVDQAALDRTAATLHAIHRALFGTLRRGGLRETTAQTIEDTRASAWYALNDLVDAGAADPRTGQGNAPTSGPVPLHLLDAPANRELLRCLLLTMEAAREVDKERGHEGDGFAEVIEHFAARVQTEIYGPADLRQEN